MNDLIWILLLIALIWIAAAWGLWKSFSVFNSPSGERYRKLRMQGPFVPLSAKEIEEDEQRKQLG